MNRLANTFKNNKLFIGYLTGGDGGLEYSIKFAQALIAGGVDILEIGLPFSDPVADGPVIQKAHERALECQTTAAKILELARKLRETSEVPLVLFSYFNPLLRKGKAYLKELKSAGFDAVLVVDLVISNDPNCSEPFFDSLEEVGLQPILLATPSTDNERLALISKKAQGFLYYVSQKGTTGVRSKMADDYSMQMARLRQYFSIPIAAGFGIADRQSAQAALEYADAFVVGSAFIKKIEANASFAELTILAQAIDPRYKLERGEK